MVNLAGRRRPSATRRATSAETWRGLTAIVRSVPSAAGGAPIFRPHDQETGLHGKMQTTDAPCRGRAQWNVPHDPPAYWATGCWPVIVVGLPASSV